MGGGLKNFEQSKRPMASVLPSQCKWIKDAAETFDPENNTITLASGNKVSVQIAVLLVFFLHQGIRLVCKLQFFLLFFCIRE